MSMASTPEDAVRTRNPADSNSSFSIVRTEDSSSTHRKVVEAAMTKIASLQMDEAPVKVGCHEDSPLIVLDNPDSSGQPQVCCSRQGWACRRSPSRRTTKFPSA